MPTTPAPHVIDHVAAHLTVATDPTAPTELREAARRTAADLMSRHDITPAAARAACGTGHSRLTIDSHPVSGTGGHGQARASFLISIATALGCKGVHQPAPAPEPYGVVLLGQAAEVRAARRLTRGIFARIHSAIAPDDPQLPDLIGGYGHTVAAAIARHYESSELHAGHRARLDALLTARFPRLATLTVEPRAYDPTARRAAADRDVVHELIDASHTPTSAEHSDPATDNQ
ncbi:hypothetical protein GA0070616_0064 [Micromonospora nigra]|uniref:DUF2786 domain-containing protein n=1 Tax=Micromonospora nigra TaxID=145857 RepID=A0A1C6R7A8_9ACTN|nr:hypothetical protein [Micromonospora nigra]SCL12919.1 hypothetical protein GA0070616_0064 [Micromonospora nigra]